MGAVFTVPIRRSFLATALSSDLAARKQQLHYSLTALSAPHGSLQTYSANQSEGSHYSQVAIEHHMSTSVASCFRIHKNANAAKLCAFVLIKLQDIDLSTAK